jgi:hypothetical protein
VHRYRAYGISIDSELPLPELPVGVPGPSDVVVRLAPVVSRPSAHPPAHHAYDVSPSQVRFFWPEVGAFEVRDGRAITIDPIPGVDERLIHLPLLGSVLGILLHQRGYLVLHASAVAIDGQVVIFLGTKGQGKSTTAASLYGQGHALLSDDVVAVDVQRPEDPMIVPGFPQLKLFAEAAAWTLGDDPERLPKLATIIEKRARSAADGFPTGPLPLAAIFALEDGDTVSVTRLSPQDAICELVGSSIPARFGQELLAGADGVQHFERCVSLLRSVPVYRLRRPHELSALSTVAEVVQQQLGQPTSAGHC